MSKRTLWTIGLPGLMVACFLAGSLSSRSFPYAFGQAGGAAKAPTWTHGLNLKARKANEADFSDKTQKFGIEVFVDENNGNTIYISETGSIAVVPKK